MPKIEIGDETHRQVLQFSRFSRAASDIELPLDLLAEFLIQVGIDHMLTSILSSQEADVLLGTILQMGRQHPEQVYGYMTDVMLRGKQIQEGKLAEMREQLERRMGFAPPKKPEA